MVRFSISRVLVRPRPRDFTNVAESATDVLCEHPKLLVLEAERKCHRQEDSDMRARDVKERKQRRQDHAKLKSSDKRQPNHDGNTRAFLGLGPVATAAVPSQRAQTHSYVQRREWDG